MAQLTAHPVRLGDKQVQLKAAMSKVRAQQTRLGALEDGRVTKILSAVDVRDALSAHGGDPDHQGRLHAELRRAVRALINRGVPSGPL